MLIFIRRTLFGLINEHQTLFLSSAAVQDLKRRLELHFDDSTSPVADNVSSFETLIA